jgi:hypothetical protein
MAEGAQPLGNPNVWSHAWKQRVQNERRKLNGVLDDQSDTVSNAIHRSHSSKPRNVRDVGKERLAAWSKASEIRDALQLSRSPSVTSAEWAWSPKKRSPSAPLLPIAEDAPLAAAQGDRSLAQVLQSYGEHPGARSSASGASSLGYARSGAPSALQGTARSNLSVKSSRASGRRSTVSLKSVQSQVETAVREQIQIELSNRAMELAERPE